MPPDSCPTAWAHNEAASAAIILEIFRKADRPSPRLSAIALPPSPSNAIPTEILLALSISIPSNISEPVGAVSHALILFRTPFNSFPEQRESATTRGTDGYMLLTYIYSGIETAPAENAALPASAALSRSPLSRYANAFLSCSAVKILTCVLPQISAALSRSRAVITGDDSIPLNQAKPPSLFWHPESSVTRESTPAP